MAWVPVAVEAAEIRAKLKAAGLSSKDVSVKSRSYSMGSSIDISVKNPDVSVKMVEAIANGHGHVDYCAYSGEILSGGNRFVHVNRSWESSKVLAARHKAAVESAAAKLGPNDDHSLVTIEGSNFLLGLIHAGSYSLWSVHKSGMVSGYHNLESAASALGSLLADEAYEAKLAAAEAKAS